MLDERRREIQAEVQGKIRDVRAEGTRGGKQNDVFDAVESSEADIQDDIEFALIQMKSETLNKIQRRARTARAGRLRQLLRMRRGDRREAAAGPALRGPLQGLRRGPRGCGEARAPDRQPSRRFVAVLRHVSIRRSTWGSAGGGAHAPLPRGRSHIEFSGSSHLLRRSPCLKDSDAPTCNDPTHDSTRRSP